MSRRRNPPPVLFTYTAPSDKMDSRIFDKIAVIDQLGHSNFATWLHRVKAAVNLSGSWQVVFRKDANGAYVGRPDTAPDCNHFDDHNRKVAIWVAEAAGVANVPLIEDFSDSGDGFGMIQALQDYYGGGNGGARYQALLSIMTMTRGVNEDFVKYLERLQLQLEEHRRLRPDDWNTVQFDDELMLAMVLVSIPESHPIRTGLLTREDLDLKAVRDAIYLYTSTTSNTSSSSKVESASLVLTPVTSQDTKCWWCTLEGHQWKSCKKMLRAKDDCQKEVTARRNQSSQSHGTSSNNSRGRGRGSSRYHPYARPNRGQETANVVQDNQVEFAGNEPHVA